MSSEKKCTQATQKPNGSSKGTIYTGRIRDISLNLPRNLQQRASSSNVIRQSKRRRTAVQLAITIPAPPPAIPARVPSSRHILNVIESNGRPAASITSPAIRAGHARDPSDALLPGPQGPHDTLIPIDPILLAETAALYQTPFRGGPPPRSSRRGPTDTENLIPAIRSPTHPEHTDAEHAIPQTHWPPEEPGKSWNSYVPRTPIPIKFRNNTADKPERPLNPTGEPTSGLRRSARLNIATKPSEASPKSKDASSKVRLCMIVLNTSGG